ncbi:hypothetical protein C8R43DRAFT_875556 [Mycena crocata]|nr:hypothetical protein C8R43DRAFT_875556 [Mycena crocata]
MVFLYHYPCPVHFFPVCDTESRPRKITYSICIYSPQQMKLKKSSRGPGVNDFLKLDSDEPWDTLKAQLLVKISEILAPQTLDFAQYSVTFTFPHQVTDPLPLNDQTQYDHLVENALNIKVEPKAKIVIESKPVHGVVANKENETEFDGADKAPKKSGKKSTVHHEIPNERQILPGNITVDTKIGEIRGKWMCPTPGPCGSEYCFVHPLDPEHLHLTHAHQHSWVSAMLKGPEFATIDKPPNNHLFDRLKPVRLGAQSPLLQRRLDAQVKTAANNAGPQININFPADLAAVLRPVAAPQAPAVPLTLPTMFIPPSLVPGLDLSIDDFCTTYNLGPDILNRFKEHKIERTDAFEYIELAELKIIKFAIGEIARLKVAIAAWGKAPPAEL